MYYIYDKDVKYTYISVSKDFNEDRSGSLWDNLFITLETDI